LSRGSKAVEAKIGGDHGAEEDSEESEDSEGEAVGTGPQKEKSRCNQRGGKKHPLLRGAMLRIFEICGEKGAESDFEDSEGQDSDGDVDLNDSENRRLIFQVRKTKTG
jgi:hypothetical protein